MIVCRCNEVSATEIQQFLKKHPHATFEELKLSTRASTSCGRCSDILKKMYDKHIQNSKPNHQFRLTFSMLVALASILVQ